MTVRVDGELFVALLDQRLKLGAHGGAGSCGGCGCGRQGRLYGRRVRVGRCCGRAHFERAVEVAARFCIAAKKQAGRGGGFVCGNVVCGATARCRSRVACCTDGRYLVGFEALLFLYIFFYVAFNFGDVYNLDAEATRCR